MDNSQPNTQLERYQRLLDISRDLASTLDLYELLSRIVNAAANLCNATEASILLYDEIKGELHFEVATNMTTPLLRGLIVPVDSSIAGWIVTNRKAIIISDAQKDRRHFSLVGASLNVTTTTLLGVPLITKNKVIGALEAINKRSGEFTQEDEDLLTALGAQAAVAIENTRLFQQSDLISVLVHELRTPMASLNTAIYLLQRTDISEDRRAKIIEMIKEEILRLSNLSTSFLDLARLESGRVQFQSEVFNLNSLLESCVEVMQPRAAEKNLSITLDAPVNLPQLTADRDKLKQVILNLLSNSIKYNFPGGKVNLSASTKPDRMLISVTDTGPGISEESIQHLFQKFYRVPGTEKMATGTGLGLSICKRIIDAHGGEIEVHSEVGKGTTFTVLLPLRGEINSPLQS